MVDGKALCRTKYPAGFEHSGRYQYGRPEKGGVGEPEACLQLEVVTIWVTDVGSEIMKLVRNWGMVAEGRVPCEHLVQGLRRQVASGRACWGEMKFRFK